MKRRNFIGAGLAGLSAGLPFGIGEVLATESKARPLPRSTAAVFDVGYVVRKPGRYILDRDAIQRAHWTIEGTYPNHPSAMLDIRSGQVDIDLGGHTLGGDLQTIGIDIRDLPASTSDDQSSRSPEGDPHGVTVRNGRIDLARGMDKGNGVGIWAMRAWKPRESTGELYGTQEVIPGPERQLWRASSDKRPRVPPLPNAFPGYEAPNANAKDGQIYEIVRRPKPSVDYVRGDYLFENLRIETYLIAVAVEGSHITLRNCTIDSGGLAAIFVAGPNVTIENCTIRLRQQSKDSVLRERRLLIRFPRLPDEILTPPRAAIVLRDGSNAVIRNNRIRVDAANPQMEGCEDYRTTHARLALCPGKRKNQCILVLDGAKNVLVEGNTFINVEGDPVTLSEGAEAIVRDNKTETRWLSF